MPYIRIRCPVGSRNVLLAEEGPLSGQAAFGTRHPETHGVLRPQGQGVCQLPPTASHHGHIDAQCGCAAGEHPGSLGAQLDHDDAALLQGLQCEGATGLPPGHGAHRQPLPGARNVLTEAK